MHPLLTQIMQGATPSLDTFFDAFGKNFSLLYALEETPQDAIWHAEGNVYIHTGMVLEETYGLLAGQASHLQPERRLALVLAALFHDIAKPLVTQVAEVRGREAIVAPRHADRGRSYLAYKLLELGMPYRVTQAVLALVGHHHDPKFLIIKDKPACDYRQLARLADLELLYYFEQADMRGRICDDLSTQLDYIELFRMFAQEYGVWQTPDVYQAWQSVIEAELGNERTELRQLVLANAIRDYEAGTIHTPHEAIARSYQYRDAFSHLVVMCGPSGAGKSSWIDEHLPDYHLLSLDALREEMTGKRSDQSKNGQVMQAAKELLKGHLRRHEKVVWDATNLRRIHRQMPLQLGFNYHAFVTLVAFHLPEADYIKRNEQRQEAKRVPRHILHKQLDKVEWVYATEAHEVIFVDGEGKQMAEKASALTHYH